MYSLTSTRLFSPTVRMLSSSNSAFARESACVSITSLKYTFSCSFTGIAAGWPTWATVTLPTTAIYNPTACCVSPCTPAGQPIARVIPIPSSRTVYRNVCRMAPSLELPRQDQAIDVALVLKGSDVGVVVGMHILKPQREVVRQLPHDRRVIIIDLVRPEDSPPRRE